jgi:hypothetical protein
MTSRPDAELPDWADEWLDGACGCGEKLVTVYGWGGAHAVCSESGRAIEDCPERKTQ